MARLRQFVTKYVWLLLALAALTVGLILQLPKFYTAAAWVLGTVAIIEAIWLLTDIIDELRSGSLHVNLLAPIAIVSAVVFNDSWAAIGVVLVVIISRMVYGKMGGHVRKTLHDRSSHIPKHIDLQRGRKFVTVLTSTVHPGNKFVVDHGEVVGVDAIIIAGDSAFDEAPLADVANPMPKKVGQVLASGSVNQGSPVTVKALRTASASQYQRISEQLGIALKSQSRLSRLADRYNLPFTLLVLLIAGAAWYFGHDSQRFVAVLVGATPCTLLWPTVPALQTGLLRLARHGLIVRSARALETLADTESLALSEAAPDTAEALKHLAAYGVRRSLFITDQPAAAVRTLAKKLGITQLYAEAETHERLQILESETKRPLAFIGDPVSDRPAMAAADLGIALTELSMPLGDTAVTSLTPSLLQLPLAMSIAQRSLKAAVRIILITTLFSLLALALLATGWLSPLMALSLQAATLVLVLLSLSFQKA